MERLSEANVCAKSNKELEIPSEFAHLEHFLDTLAETVKELHKRLEPVMTEPRPREEKSKEEVVSTVIGSKLREATNRVRTTNDVIQDMIARLEI